MAKSNIMKILTKLGKTNNLWSQMAYNWPKKVKTMHGFTMKNEHCTLVISVLLSF